jgi:hypothetical protein
VGVCVVVWDDVKDAVLLAVPEGVLVKDEVPVWVEVVVTLGVAVFVAVKEIEEVTEEDSDGVGVIEGEPAKGMLITSCD